MEASSGAVWARGVCDRARTGWVEGGGVILDEGGGGDVKADLSSFAVDSSATIGGGVEGMRISVSIADTARV